jgi:exodeoxyribonuclease VII small subunit
MIPPRRSPDAEPAADSAKFENLLGRLEQIVSDMEGTDLPLEKLLSSYEEGMRLVKACGDRLTDAEQKVEILSKVAPAGAPSATTNSAAASAASLGDTALTLEKGDDEIRLI